MVGVGGSTVIVVRVGLTKNPRQPKPAALTRRTAKAARSCSFRFVLSIVGTLRTLFFSIHPSGACQIVAENDSAIGDHALSFFQSNCLDRQALDSQTGA